MKNNNTQTKQASIQALSYMLPVVYAILLLQCSLRESAHSVYMCEPRVSSSRFHRVGLLRSSIPSAVCKAIMLLHVHG